MIDELVYIYFIDGRFVSDIGEEIPLDMLERWHHPQSHGNPIWIEENVSDLAKVMYNLLK